MARFPGRSTWEPYSGIRALNPPNQWGFADERIQQKEEGQGYKGTKSIDGGRKEDGTDREVSSELAKVTRELQCSMDKTHFILYHNLDETQSI